MARIEVYSDRVVIKLTRAERALSMRSRDIVLDRAAIASALITEDPWVWLHGVRSPGTRVPGRLAIGTWRGHGGKDFALIRSGREAIVLDFERSPFRDGRDERDDAGDSSDAPARAPGEQLGERGWQTEFDDFARVILSTTHAADLIRALRLEGGADAPITIEQ